MDYKRDQYNNINTHGHWGLKAVHSSIPMDLEGRQQGKGHRQVLQQVFLALASVVFKFEMHELRQPASLKDIPHFRRVQDDILVPVMNGGGPI